MDHIGGLNKVTQSLVIIWTILKYMLQWNSPNNFGGGEIYEIKGITSTILVSFEPVQV